VQCGDNSYRDNEDYDEIPQIGQIVHDV
jgi:hypothetical protein